MGPFTETPTNGIGTGAFGTSYRFDLAGAGSLTARADLSYQDQVFYTADNAPRASQGGYSLLNARLTWENADGSWSKQVAGFSKSGELRSLSEWMPKSLADLPSNTDPSDGASSIAPSPYTIFDDRDAFGRPRILWQPSGKRVSVAYSGIRKIATTLSIATALDGSETQFTTSRYFDSYGRLVKVEEPGEALAAAMLRGMVPLMENISASACWTRR